jgi:hypothetical protein
VQFGWVTGGEVSDNFGEVVPERATAGEHELEDHINMFASRDILLERNYLRGGDSPSGCGITLGDGGPSGSGANWTARGNTLIRTGNCGIGIGGGTNAVVDGNRLLDTSLPGGMGNVGIYIWDVYGVGGCAGHTVTNNVVSNRRPEGVYADIYDARTCGPVAMTGNVTGDAARARLTPEATQLPAPPIPPLRYADGGAGTGGGGTGGGGTGSGGTGGGGRRTIRLVTGPGRGTSSRVKGTTGTEALTTLITPYGPAFSGGVFVAVAPAAPDADGAIVTGTGGGGGPHVRVFNADGSPQPTSFFAYDPAFTGGVRVAACDLDGDGRPEIVTAMGPGGEPHVRVFKVHPPGQAVTELAGFYAYARGFTGGVFVACGDVDGDGVADIVTGTDAGGGPHVRVFRVGASVSEVAGFFAFDPGFTGGVRVAAGNLDASDRASIIVGAGVGGGPHIRALKLHPAGGLAELASFFPFDPGFTGGVFVGAGRVTGGAAADIITGAGAGGGPHVRVFTGTGADTGVAFMAYEAMFGGGVTVSGLLP